jgi:hypothetical protein
MKKLKLYLLTACIFAISMAVQSQSSISMGTGYANDIYYKVFDGVVGVADRTEWDLGFFTTPESYSIITNDGCGIELYVYPNGDTNAWMSIDTNGMAASWPILYNGGDSWQNGAFNRNSTGHPDYGWGIYNEVTHNVVGDSLFVIKIDTSWKKLWIVRKRTAENKYTIRYANLDNSSEKEKTLKNNDYVGTNFSYFDFESESFFDREPDTEDWDILFTKYNTILPNGLPFSVVGVLNNVGVKANKFHPVPLDFNDWNDQPLDASKIVIGYNWKWFSMGTMQWMLEDSLLFFVQSLDGNIYKLYFTYYAGTSSGDIEFMEELVSMVDIDEISADDGKLQLSPNPAQEFVTIRWNTDLGGTAIVRIFDLSGKEVLNRELQVNEKTGKQLRLDVSSLHEGMYVISITSAQRVINEKLLIE